MPRKSDPRHSASDCRLAACRRPGLVCCGELAAQGRSQARARSGAPFKSKRNTVLPGLSGARVRRGANRSSEKRRNAPTAPTSHVSGPVTRRTSSGSRRHRGEPGPLGRDHETHRDGDDRRSTDTWPLAERLCRGARDGEEQREEDVERREVPVCQESRQYRAQAAGYEGRPDPHPEARSAMIAHSAAPDAIVTTRELHSPSRRIQSSPSMPGGRVGARSLCPWRKRSLARGGCSEFPGSTPAPMSDAARTYVGSSKVGPSIRASRTASEALSAAEAAATTSVTLELLVDTPPCTARVNLLERLTCGGPGREGGERVGALDSLPNLLDRRHSARRLWRLRDHDPRRSGAEQASPAGRNSPIGPRTLAGAWGGAGSAAPRAAARSRATDRRRQTKSRRGLDADVPATATP